MSMTIHKSTPMRKIIGSLLLVTCIAFTGMSQTAEVGQYLSAEPYNNLFAASIEALADIEFSATQTDKDNGVILAEKGGSNVVIRFFEGYGDKVMIEASFDQISEEPDQQIIEYGQALKSRILDLESDLELN